ncbi:MAG TPA: class I SAM-dependent methyltransferase [Vicinamibacterales bacterium]|nr:class I SAM-dependent methyltransferase [Vicinamibacterales bacterium]
MFTLDQVVPWGRSFAEYRRMFSLSDDDLAHTILGCGDGPASFNAEATGLGVRVTSCDPIYGFAAAQLQQRIDATAAEVLAQTRRNAHEFVWDVIPSVDALRDTRLAAMQLFLEDFERGQAEGRYVTASLPTLPFADAAFDLALSSHFLFLYTTQLGEDFHRRAVREMCRVAREVRIFPLVALGGAASPLVDPVCADLRADGFIVAVELVGYEFQRGANQMLRIRRSPGVVART